MSGKMRKRQRAQPRVVTTTHPATKAFHAPQKDSSRRQRKKHTTTREERDV